MLQNYMCGLRDYLCHCVEITLVSLPAFAEAVNEFDNDQLIKCNAKQDEPKENYHSAVPLSSTEQFNVVYFMAYNTILVHSHQPPVEAQQAAVFSRKCSDKPSVHCLLSTKRQTD